MTDTTARQWQGSGMQEHDLLHELSPELREAVVHAIGHSASAGWPASRESVRILVAYAQGRISAREYAVQILVALGYADGQAAAAALIATQPPTPAAEPARPTARFNADAGHGFLLGD